MTESYSFYVTAGRGTEIFVEKEIREKLKITSVFKRDGKVFMEVSQEKLKVDQILALKSVERAFIAITDYDNQNFITDKRTFLDKLMNEIITTNNFSKALTVLKQFHLVLTRKKCPHQNEHATENIQPRQSNAESLNKSEKIISEGTDQCGRCMRKREGKAQDEPREIAYFPLEKRKKMESPQGTTSVDFTTAASIQKVSNNGFLNVQPSSETLCTGINPANLNEESRAVIENIKSLSTFRVSVKCSGKVKRWLDLKRLSKDIGWRVSKRTGWIVDLQSPELEVCVHISDANVTAGIPLTRFPLSKREYLVDSGLRAPIAWIMCHLANIKPGEIILDPMCGKATILVEACTEFQASYIGSDCDGDQLAAAIQNVDSLRLLMNNVSLVKSDGLDMPYRDSCVDIVMCDAPFNRNHKTSIAVDEFYFKFIHEIDRVLAPQGRCVLLTKQDLKDLVISIVNGNLSDDSKIRTCRVKAPVHLSVASINYIKLGETHASIIVLNKQ
ncbi:unnamed protein product [Lymnaea stagnalis]|uniref:Ribosomal RNA large subunit methyltransferase K/L-like methyltransferase domain-containing protein n=1 Tax=Lymnaea stagnalis TaxID=6523 RepID=A0AAV2HCT5_LYMST